MPDPEQNNVEDESLENPPADGNSIQDIADLLGHAADEQESGEQKPKEEGQEPAPKDEGGKPEGGKEGTPESQTPKPGEEAKPQPEAKPEQSLKDVLKEVMNEVKAEKPATEVKPQEEQKPEGPKYSPMVPDAIMAAIESEDPKVRQQGVSAMIGGAMNRVYADLKKEFDARLATTLQQVPQIIQAQQQAQTEAKKAHDTFYEENPNFGTSPARKQLVAQTAIMLAQSEGKEYKGFTSEFRTKLAARLEEMSGIPKGKAPAKPAAKDVKPAAKPGFQAGNSPARSSETQMTLSDEIFDVISSVVN